MSEGKLVTPYSRTVQGMSDNRTKLDGIIDKSKQHNIEYGTIEEVDLKTSRVRVKRLNGEELRGGTVDGERNAKFFPLMTPMTTIHMLYGPLVKGLKVRIHWIGQLEPESFVMVDLVSNQNLVQQDYELPDIERGFSMPL